MALGANADVEQRFEVFEVLVVGAKQRLDAFFGNGDALDAVISLYCSDLVAHYSTGSGRQAGQARRQARKQA